jgi:hypothetical protein
MIELLYRVLLLFLPLVILVVFVLTTVFFRFVWIPVLIIINNKLFWGGDILCPEYKILIQAFLMLVETILFLCLCGAVIKFTFRNSSQITEKDSNGNEEKLS